MEFRPGGFAKIGLEFQISIRVAGVARYIPHGTIVRIIEDGGAWFAFEFEGARFTLSKGAATVVGERELHCWKLEGF